MDRPGASSSVDTWTERLGLSSAPLTPDIYTSQRQFELERDLIFRRTWLNLGRVEDIPHPGDYVVHDLPLFPTSILLVHGRDGVIRGFHNMCTHRGNKLCPKLAGPEAFVKQGNKRFFSCEFHGWVFDHQGQLVDIPDEGEFFGLDRATLGLKAVATDVWEGFIFVNLDPHPRQTLREHLGPIVTELAGYPFSEYTTIFGYEGELQCNWKLSVDSQIEGYHAVTLHRRTLGGALGGTQDNPMLHMLEFATFGNHFRLSMPGEHTPPRGTIDGLASGLMPSIRAYTTDRLSKLPPGINPTRSDKWVADIYFIWPNFWIAPFDGQYQTHNFWPLAVDRMYQRIVMRGPQPKSNSQRWALEYARVMSSNVWLEDFSTLEETHEMASSGQLERLHFQDQEVLCRYFHKIVREHIGLAPPTVGADGDQ